jgi:hypothetical protein
MAFNKTLNFDVPGNFTYDSSLIEVTGGSAALKRASAPANLTFYSRYDSSIDGTLGTGVLTGTAYGGAVVSGGRLDLSGNTVKYVKYDGVSNASTASSKGCVRFKYTPNVSGAPGAGNDRYFFSIQDSTASTSNYGLGVFHRFAGELYITIRGTSADILVKDCGVWSPVAGTTYEIELNYDLTAGNARLFVNGIQHGTTATFTAGQSRPAINEILVGTLASRTGKMDGYIDDFTIFSEVQHTANFASEVPRLGLNLYPTTNPTITVNDSQDLSSISDFVATTLISGSDAVRFLIKVNGTAKYWNQTMWTTSNGTYAQANTAAELAANLATLNVSSGVTIQLVAFLHSDTGVTTPTLASFSFSYGFYDVPTDPNECTVYVHLKDVFGVKYAPSDAKLTAKLLSSFAYGDTLIISQTQTVNFDSNGDAHLTLVESATSGKTYQFTITFSDSGSTRTVKFSPCVVPNQVSAALVQIATIASG